MRDNMRISIESMTEVEVLPLVLNRGDMMAFKISDILRLISGNV